MADLCEIFGVTEEEFLESVKNAADEIKEDETYN